MGESQHVLKVIDATVVTAQNSLLHLLNSLQKSYMMFDCILILSQNKLIKDHDTLLPLQHPGAIHACSYPTRIPSLVVSVRYLIHYLGQVWGIFVAVLVDSLAGP